jgi:hypothetical protein
MTFLSSPADRTHFEIPSHSRCRTLRAVVLALLLCTMNLGRLVADEPPVLNTPDATAQQAGSELAVRIDFSGGSAVVEGIDQQRRLIRISPSNHKDRGWVCWWYFRVQGIVPGEVLTLDVGNGVWATPDRAAMSRDNNIWRQTPAGKREKDRIVYSVRVDGPEAWFAWGPPFVPEDAQALVDAAAKSSPFAESFELCKTREGRSTPALRVSQPGVPDAERLGLWIQARQHAWESGSSWVGKGFVDWLVSDDPRAEALRKKAVITIVPIMDIDNAARGAGGKNQIPQDHNRDWTDEPHWRAVAAAQLEIKKLAADGRFDLFVDLHNPGANARHPYYYIVPRELLSEIGLRNLDRFLEASRTEITGPLSFQGQTIESGGNYDKNWKAISKNWVAANTGDHVVSLTLETAWNTPHGTPDGYEQVGRELGMAIERYLREPVRK